MKKENIEKWFGSLKKDENTGNYTDEFIPGKKLKRENAKEFFFDFDCSIVNFIERIDIYQDWKNLNISDEKIIEWTSAFYSKDILKYDEMNFKKKLYYCERLGGLLEHFNKPLIIDITNKFINLLEYKEIEKINNAQKRGIAKSIISYLSTKVISKDKFFGYLPNLIRVNEIDLATNLINIYINFLLKSNRAFNESGFVKIDYYYDVLMKFNVNYNLKYDSIIERIKSEMPCDNSTDR